MKKDEFNSRIRLCFESVPDDLGDDLCLVTGALIIVQKVNSKWAYGYHLKSQGGGTFGEYHIVCKAEWNQESEWANWSLSVGDYRVFDSSTTKSFEGCGEEETIEMFGELDILWDNILKMGWDLEVDSPYDELFLCYKSDFNNLVDSQSSFWYSEDNFDTDDERYLGWLDIEYVSGEIPGNMMFVD